ncbi:hypothetical protein L208DRAFT_1306213, partial [Tricholoma matsutake]
MTKIINSLSAKMEMGSPMICMYLLDIPDHFKSHKFHTFFWQSFVSEARKPWEGGQDGTSKCDILLEDPAPPKEKVMLIRFNGSVTGLSPVYDYIYQSRDLDNMSLYDWVARCEWGKLPA